MTYRILKPIVLGFIFDDEQHDILFKPENGAILKREGNTIHVKSRGTWYESTTTPNFIEMALHKGSIEPKCPDCENLSIQPLE